MADGQPDMIPMPGPPTPNDREPMPESFERKLSPDEERSLLVNFMGAMYGETKKIDSNIVGASNTLERGKSEKIKRHIEQVISQPQQPVQQVQAALPPRPIDIHVQEPTYPENNLPEVQVSQPVQPIQMPVDNNQLTFDFDVNEKEELFLLIEKVLTRLDKLHRKVDEISIVHSDFIKTCQSVNPVTAKKKSVESKKET